MGAWQLRTQTRVTVTPKSALAQYILRKNA
jgi:hypothetical protein